MDPYIILAKTEQGAWIETKEIGTSQWSLQQSSKIKQEQLILAQGEDSKKGQLIYLMWKGSFQVILYKMIRFLSGKLKEHTKLAKIVKISEIFNRLVFPLNFNRFCHPMTYVQRMGIPEGGVSQRGWVCPGDGYPRGGYSPCPLDMRPGDEYPPPVDRQTHVKTWPSVN